MREEAVSGGPLMEQEITGRDLLLACAEVLAIAAGGAALVYWWFQLPF